MALKTYSILNEKGGVGKTTTTVNLGAAIAEFGHTVLLVDADPHRGLSIHLGVEEPEFTIERALFDKSIAPEALVHPTCAENMYLIPAGEDLAGVELLLAKEMNRERLMTKMLRPIRDRFDYVLIDNSPSLGLLVINALAASDSVIIPVQAEFLSLKALGPLLRTIETTRESEVQPTLDIAGILPTMFNPTRKQCGDVVEALKQEFGEKVFKTPIRVRAQFAYASSQGQPVTLFDPKSDAAEMYRTMARELLGHEAAAPSEKKLTA